MVLSEVEILRRFQLTCFKHPYKSKLETHGLIAGRFRGRLRSCKLPQMTARLGAADSPWRVEIDSWADASASSVRRAARTRLETDAEAVADSPCIVCGEVVDENDAYDPTAPIIGCPSLLVCSGPCGGMMVHTCCHVPSPLTGRPKGDYARESPTWPAREVRGEECARVIATDDELRDQSVEEGQQAWWSG